MNLQDVFNEFRDQITLNHVTYEDKYLELLINNMGSSIFISIEFENDNLDSIQIYGTGLEDILTVELRNYLDDEDLCREVPVDLFISEMSKQDQIHFQSYGFDDL